MIVKDQSNKKKLFSNFLSLSFVQIANYLLPLITIPYLVRVLGPDKYGLISFAQALILYFSVITNYDFNLSAPRVISINRDDPFLISKIFNSIMLIKFILMILSFIVLCIIIISFDKFRDDWLIYLFSFGIVLADALFPIWFFQGVERMKSIAVLNILSKLLFAISIFILISSQEHYIFVPLLNSIFLVVTAFIGLLIAFKKFNIKLFIPSFNDLKLQISQGWNIFLSNVSISLYTISNTFILGIFTNDTIVGYYSAAEKIIKAVQGLLNPVVQSLYPHISKIAIESKETALLIIKKLSKRVGLITFVISTFIFVYSDHIINLFLGDKFEQSVIVLRILSFQPFLIGISFFYANLFLLGFGYTKTWSKIIISASVIDILLVIFFVVIIPLKHIGVSLGWFLTELFVATFSYIYFIKLKSK